MSKAVRVRVRVRKLGSEDEMVFLSLSLGVRGM